MEIAGKVTPLGGEQFAIVFRPARNLPAVAQVTFQGNQVIPQGVLREAVHGDRGQGDAPWRGAVRHRVSPGAQSAGGGAGYLSGESGDPAGRIARGRPWRSRAR